VGAAGGASSARVTTAASTAVSRQAANVPNFMSFLLDRGRRYTGRAGAAPVVWTNIEA